ncbi:MAG: tRNA pseudouridine(55) synthase TruB [Gammaproteobacteria bacterium]|nr:MAG: tRNA pseudouridine(55) synthase TruB [Gammaproteobacteria bacterium]
MAKVPFRALNGVLLLDKNRDVSSNKALQDARFTYRAKKAGHTGTLDPFATGLLPVCFGEANKYARWLIDADKTYRFTAVLGQQSTTGDTEGEITVIDSSPRMTVLELQSAEQKFLGEVTQIPPKYSAIKINGQRAYDLARAGKDFDIPTREVTIHSLSLSLDENILTGITKVSKGTYIRTLVEDIAAHLGTVAYCQELRRLQIANLFSDDENNPRPMYTVEQIRAISEESERDKLLLPMDLLCQQFPKQTILSAHWEMLIRGRQTSIDSDQIGIVRLYLDNVFHGLGEISQGRLKAFRLLNTGF